MSTVHPDDPADTAELGRITITLSVAVPTKVLDKADPDHAQRMLAAAALHLGDEGKPEALGLLFGSAVQAACEGNTSQAALAMGAAVVILQGIHASRAQGVIA